jgi:hypothetical protein
LTIVAFVPYLMHGDRKYARARTRDSVAAAVAAINKALGAIYAKFTADLARL